MTWSLEGVEDERGHKSEWSTETADLLNAVKPELSEFVHAVAAVGMSGRRLRKSNDRKSMQELQTRAEQAERATLHLGAAVPGVEDVRATFIRLSRYVSAANRFRNVSDSASESASGEMSTSDFASQHEAMCGAMEEHQGVLRELESAIEYSLLSAERLWKSQ